MEKHEFFLTSSLLLLLPMIHNRQFMILSHHHYLAFNHPPLKQVVAHERRRSERVKKREPLYLLFSCFCVIQLTFDVLNQFRSMRVFIDLGRWVSILSVVFLLMMCFSKGKNVKVFRNGGKKYWIQIIILKNISTL